MLEDAINGVFDFEDEHTIIDMRNTNKKYYQNSQKGQNFEGIVYWTSYILAERNTLYQRIAYNFMEVLGDVGGITEMIFLFAGWLLRPVNYNISGIKMLKHYVKQGEHQKMSDLTLSLKSLFYDLGDKYSCLK